MATTQAPSDKLRFGNVPKHWDTEKIGRSLSAQGCGQIYDLEVGVGVGVGAVCGVKEGGRSNSRPSNDMGVIYI